jgi:hypothetical protein
VRPNQMTSGGNSAPAALVTMTRAPKPSAAGRTGSPNHAFPGFPAVDRRPAKLDLPAVGTSCRRAV